MQLSRRREKKERKQQVAARKKKKKARGGAERRAEVTASLRLLDGVSKHDASFQLSCIHAVSVDGLDEIIFAVITS